MVRVAQKGGPFGTQRGELQDDPPGVAGVVLLAQPSAHGPFQKGGSGAVGSGGGEGRRNRDVGDLSGMHGLGGQDGETHLERVDAGVDRLERMRVGLIQADAVAFELLNGQADETGGLGIDDGAVGVTRLLAIGGGGDKVIKCLEPLIET